MTTVFRVWLLPLSAALNHMSEDKCGFWPSSDGFPSVCPGFSPAGGIAEWKYATESRPGYTALATTFRGLP